MTKHSHENRKAFQQPCAKRPIIGFVGLPSAGKSSLINSLVGRRILKTGVCRTTKEPHIIGPNNAFSLPNSSFHDEDPLSDDGIAFSILDLPGVADSENDEKEEVNFEQLTTKWVIKCDVVIWVSDVNTAFLTTHEKREFERIHDLLKQHQLETGKLCQCCILLSKYNYDDTEVDEPMHDSSLKLDPSSCGEIFDEEEDTTAVNCLERVQKLFHDYKGFNIPLIKFNAFGRVLSNSNTSCQLRKLVRRVAPGAADIHTEFELGRFFQNLEEQQQDAYLANLVAHYLPRIKQTHPLASLRENLVSYQSLRDTSQYEAARNMLDVISSHDSVFSKLTFSSSPLASIMRSKARGSKVHKKVFTNNLPRWVQTERYNAQNDYKHGYLASSRANTAALIEQIDDHMPAPTTSEISVIKGPFQLLKNGSQLLSLSKILFSSNAFELQLALKQCNLAAASLEYNEEAFNSICFCLGGLEENSAKLHDALAKWRPTSSCAAFRAHCLLGRTTNRALQLIYSCEPSFATSLLVGNQLLQVKLDKGPSRLPAALLPPKKLCQFDSDCLTEAIASRCWQAKLVRELANLWQLSEEEELDLDGLALAMLMCNGKITSVFTRVCLKTCMGVLHQPRFGSRLSSSSSSSYSSYGGPSYSNDGGGNYGGGHNAIE